MEADAPSLGQFIADAGHLPLHDCAVDCETHGKVMAKQIACYRQWLPV
jgi:hypothetical protein